ncbi:MAG: hypothetical protein DRI90_26310 [Deltaproteobacteria bacterium]|nr:MAG: hypothetical protein DRI90_26310 [Deltaproteobacteria bacterium]
MTNDSFACRYGTVAAHACASTVRVWVGLACLTVLAACGGSAPMVSEAPAPGGDYGSHGAVASQAEMVAEKSDLAPPPSPPGIAAEAGGMSPQPMAAPGAADRTTKRSAPPSKSVGAKEPAPKSTKLAGAPIAQMLIFTGQLRLLVNPTQYAQRIDAVIDIAVAMGGYISRHDNQNVTVRVPSGRFRDALKEMEKLGEVTHREIQAQDVSEEFHDLGVRLKSLRATQQRLEDFLKRAKNIQEVLRIEQELSRLNGEIDRIEGRRRYLSARATFSTITVSFQPKPKDQIAIDPDDPPPPPPPPNTIPLPIDWLSKVGLSQLLQLR